MIRVKIKTKTVLQEALTLEAMGLPQILTTFIKEDLKRREDQVRLALILKDEPFAAKTADAPAFKTTSTISFGLPAPPDAITGTETFSEISFVSFKLSINLL